MADAVSKSTIDLVLEKADEVFTFVEEISPDIPEYGALIGLIAKGGKAIISLEPTAVQVFYQIKNTVTGGVPPTEAQLAQWAKETDAANDQLAAHIKAQYKQS